MKATKIITSVAIALIITACGPSRSEYKALVEENKRLSEQNDFLTAQVENYKVDLELFQTAPDILLSEAKDFIDKKDREGLDNIVQLLKKYHPSSQEYQKAKTALNSLDREIELKNIEEQRKINAEKEKRKQAVKKLKSKHDDINGTTWYENPYFTHYNNTNHISLYMGKKEGGRPWLRLKMSYAGDNWIFFDEAYLSYDGNTRKVYFDKYKEKESDNSGGGVWEWIDVSVPEPMMYYLQEMVNGKSVKMRLTGKYERTRTLTTAEINGIKDVLLAYDVLLNGIDD